MANESFRTIQSTKKIIIALKELIKKWAANIHLEGNEQLIETNSIHYLQGIFPGNSVSVLLFIQWINSLSVLLNKLQRDCIGTSRH